MAARRLLHKKHLAKFTAWLRAQGYTPRHCGNFQVINMAKAGAPPVIVYRHSRSIPGRRGGPGGCLLEGKMPTSTQMTLREKGIYLAGLKEGITRFAWWKDGVQFVGTCGTRLEDALKEAEREVGKS